MRRRKPEITHELNVLSNVLNKGVSVRTHRPHTVFNYYLTTKKLKLTRHDEWLPSSSVTEQTQGCNLDHATTVPFPILYNASLYIHLTIWQSRNTKIPPSTSWRHEGEWRYGSTYPQSRHLMTSVDSFTARSLYPP